MPTRNVNLTDHYDSFIDISIASGRFSNASEAVRAGLYLLERQEAEDQAKIEWLRGTTKEAFAAFDRGEGVSLSSADDIDALVNGAIEETEVVMGKRRMVSLGGGVAGLPEVGEAAVA